MENELNKERDYSAEYENFMVETIQSYKDEIEKYSLEIDRGDNSSAKYSLFFQAYRTLYEFTNGDKKYKCIDKFIVDNVCDKFLAVVQEEMSKNENIASNYCHLAEIADYKKDKKKAIQYYNMAVQEDESYISRRAQYKNHALNDRAGALADYARALEIEQDPKERGYIQHLIDNIDLIRNTDKTIRSSNIQVFIAILTLIGVLIYAFGDIIYQIYKAIIK